MSTSTYPSSSPSKKRVSKAAPKRALSASQIAKNSNHFETWSSRQCIEQVLYSDIPKEIKKQVDVVLDVSARIPKTWITEGSDTQKLVSKICMPGFLDFLKDAEQGDSNLFSADDTQTTQADMNLLYDQLATVFRAWKSLKEMKASEEKFSEAEFATACNIFRTPAITQSRQRAQCSISLPQPIHTSKLHTDSIRILDAKTVIPDTVLFIPRPLISKLFHSEKSPFKTLKKHKTILRSGCAEKGSSFPFQCTPRSTLPDPQGFEFASSFWEDKKPVHPMLEHAYRQNRMSTTTAVRHLDSLGINAPVFGLVWANGTVRAHVDWCKHSSDGSSTTTILSAPFPGGTQLDGDRSFHEWLLERPADILQVHFLLRNIDHWTCHEFTDIVIAGVNAFQKSVVEEGGKYTPWKRVGTLKPGKGRRSSGSTASSPTAPPKTRKRSAKGVK